MQVSLRGMGDPVYPIGFDSMGIPIYPSGITADQLANAPTTMPETVVVTPTQDFLTNPATGQQMAVTPGSTVTLNPATGQVTVVPPQSSSSGMLVLLATVAAVIILAK